MKTKRKYKVVTEEKEFSYDFAKDVIDFLKDHMQERGIDIYEDRECLFMLNEGELILYNNTVRIPKCLYNFIMKNYIKSEDCIIKTLDFLK